MCFFNNKVFLPLSSVNAIASYPVISTNFVKFGDERITQTDEIIAKKEPDISRNDVTPTNYVK